MAEVQKQMKTPEEPLEKTMDNNPTWQALQQCQIMLPLDCLLQLVPRFTKGLVSALTSQNPEPTPPFFSNPKEGPTIVDTNNPKIIVIIKGREIPRKIVDRGFGVNVINQRICNTLGIREWELCPFWLRIMDTGSVGSTGLIRNLEITSRGHAFRISAVVLQLNAQRAYPMLLGRPWLRIAHIKQN